MESLGAAEPVSRISGETLAKARRELREVRSAATSPPIETHLRLGGCV